MRLLASIIAAALVVALASCSGVKSLGRADTTLPPAFDMSAPLSADTATIADLCWWEVYADTTLRRIITRTLDNNRDMLAAAARVEEMRLRYGVAKASGLPELSVMAGGSHETNNYDGAGNTNDPEVDLKATLAWEVNLWGRMKWVNEQGAAAYRVSVEDMRAMRMTLIAETATAYFNYVALNNELAIVRQTIKLRGEALDLARIRFEGGMTSEIVYQQAKVEYATAASLIPELERQISRTRNALSLLTGDLEATLLPEGLTGWDVPLPEKIPLGLPSGLLRRRPDLMAAEARLRSSMAAVGISYADRFPSLRLTLTGGLENDGLGKFLKSPFSYIAGSVAGPVFDFGRRKKNYQAAIAAYDQSRYAYEQSVMTAFVEVSDAIHDYRRAAETRQLKQTLRESAAKYLRLATVQYRYSDINYLDVLDAQRRYLEAEVQASNAIRDEYLALVGLYKSLGGGWQPPAHFIQ